MRTFLLKILLFAGLLAAVFGFLYSRADGYLDPFYRRFTSPKQTSLILGTSRAAQGVLPQVLDSVLGKHFVNYSFTVDHSPFGPVYEASIRRKLSKDGTDGIFIVCVDPWSLSSTTEDPDDSTSFRENHRQLGGLQCVNMDPNVEYLFKNVKLKDYYRKFIVRPERHMFLHDDGWLAVNVPMDSANVARRTKRKVADYNNKVKRDYRYSPLRLRSLCSTITFLKQHGEVYLVRLPAHPELYAVEQEVMPDFDEKIRPAVELAGHYLDLMPENREYAYVDGNHLYKESGRQVSARIGRWVRSMRGPAVQ